MKRNGRFFDFILPIVGLYLLENALVTFMSQVSLAYIVLNDMPIKLSELLEKSRQYFASIDFSANLILLRGVVGIVLFVIWYKHLKEKSQSENEGKVEVDLQKRSKLLVIPAIILIALGFQFAGGILVQFLTQAFPSWLLAYTNTLNSIGLSVTGSNIEAPMRILIYTVLVAPIMEEVIFRGVSLRYAQNAMSPMAANIVCAITFASYHGNMLQGVYTFVFALILGFVMIKTNDLRIVIAIHIVFNTVSAFLAEYIYLGENPFATFAIMFTSMAAIYLGCVLVSAVFTGDEG